MPEINSFCAHIPHCGHPDCFFLSPLSPLWTCSHFTFSFQGFDGIALTPGEAAMIIHNYEVRTGHVVSMTELESGYLKGQLCPEDYDIKQRVSQYERQNLPMGPLPRVPFRRAHSHTLPQDGSRLIRSCSFPHFQPQGIDSLPSSWLAGGSCHSFARPVSFD